MPSPLDAYAGRRGSIDIKVPKMPTFSEHFARGGLKAGVASWDAAMEKWRQELQRVLPDSGTITEQVTTIINNIVNPPSTGGGGGGGGGGPTPPPFDPSAILALIAALENSLNNHILQNIVHGTTSPVVGETDEQALERKTIGFVFPRNAKFQHMIQVNEVIAGEIFTVPAGYNMIVAGDFSVDPTGELEIAVGANFSAVGEAEQVPGNVSTDDVELVEDEIVVGAGGKKIKTKLSPGDPSFFLSGGGSPPEFTRVRDEYLLFSDITTGNASTEHHGFLPKRTGSNGDFLRGDGAWAPIPLQAVSDADIIFADILTNNVTSSKHGFAPKSPGDPTKFLNGDVVPSYEFVKDSDLALTDVTDNDVTTGRHGFVPKLTGVEGMYFDAEGNYSDPTGGLAVGRFKFDTSTAASDPGVGKIRLNAGTWAAATAVYIDQFSDLSTDVSALIIALETNDQIFIQDRNDSGKYGRFTVSAPATNNTGWFTIPVTNLKNAGTVPSNNQPTIVIGDFGSSGGSAITALTGDVTATGPGSAAATIANNVVSFAKMQQIATDRLLGRDSASTGNVEEISVGGGLEFTGATGIQRSALTGDVTASAGSNATTIANDAVTFAKMQNLSAERLLGRGEGGGSGDPQEITLGTGLSMSGTELNSVTDFYDYFYYSAMVPENTSLFEWNMNVSQVTNVAATWSGPDTSQPPSILLTTSNVNGNQASWASGTGDFDWLPYNRRLEYEAWIRPVDTTDVRYSIGMSAAALTNTNAPTSNCALLMASTTAVGGVTTGNWYAYVNNGTSTESIDTGVARSASTAVRLGIRWDGTTTGKIKFYINGTLVATSTLDLTSTQVLGFVMVCTTLAASAKTWKISGVHIRVKYASFS